MNKFLLLALAVLMPMWFIGCGKEFEDNPPKDELSDESENKEMLIFSKSFHTIEPNSLKMEIGIFAKVEYEFEEIENEDSWLSYSLSDDILRISAKPNNEEKEHIAKFVIYNENEKLSDTLTVTQPINKERVALIKIYKALNGDNWANNENWCSDKPLNEWNGIMANGDEHVTRLWAHNDAFINGEIPECIGDLIYLDHLSFEGTNVKGKLPESIGKLTRLEYLTIADCKFEGEIPKSIENCTLLEYVDLNRNSFTGKIPEYFFQCENIKSLTIVGNRFTEFTIDKNPVSDKLHTLYISDNEISSPIPEKLFMCKGLRFIDARNNHITGNIPNSIGGALNLESIDLSDNEIEGELPSEISTDSKLGNITIPNNKLSGKIPECYAHLNLLVFDVRNNYLDIEGSYYIKDNPNYDDWRLLPQN